MSQNKVIIAEHISLSYQLRRSLSIKRLFTATEESSEASMVHALQDVSFSLNEGGNLGVVGTNGSGKSTLLRILSKAYSPDNGKITIHVPTIQLLTLGTGFMNSLSGRDNLYLNALMLGISKAELSEGLVHQIIEFSELGEFIDRPMYTYSSGMCARLMFSVAACIQPDLLLLDELFSVGDLGFVEKSSARVQQFVDSDKSVVMVSHDSEVIERNCSMILWLHKGQVKMFDTAKIVVKEYKDFVLGGQHTD